MLGFNQFCALSFWIYSLTLVQHVKGCTLEQFKESSAYDDNFEVSSLKQSYESGDSVRVRCKVGFRGFFRLICSRGQWTNVGEKCRQISCGHPGDVPFADFRLVKGTDYEFGSQVQYVCHKGYQMSSYTSTRNCLEQGWDGHLPECEPISCPSLSVDNNVLANGDVDQATSGSVVQFSCKSREDMLEGPTQIVCGDDGQWDNKAPTCTKLFCTKPPLEKFRVEVEKMEYEKDEVLRYKCDPGYKKVDGRPSLCKRVGHSAQWTPTPQCEVITCKLTIPPPKGTTYTPMNLNSFNVGDRVTVSCGEKQWVKMKALQSAELICQDTGNWDYDPVCQMVTCPKRAENVYRWQSTWYNSVSVDEELWYQCYGDYEEASPTSRATCTRGGWEPNPLCKERRCSKPSHKNAEITDYYVYNKYDHNDRVHWKCTYDPTVTFYSDCYYGEWKGRNPTCREKPCSTQPQVEYGEMLDERKSEYEHGDSLWFRCISETRSFKVTCESGEWKKQKSCQDVACTKQPDIPNGQIAEGHEKSRYQHRETVLIRCTTGSQESFTISCQSGEWISEQQCPEKSACGSTDVPNGFSHEKENTLYYTCNEGFKLLTKGWWGAASCVEGEWKTSQCVDITDCGPVPEIPNLNVTSEREKFSDGETFPIQCDTGHQNLYPDFQELTCVKGKWTLNNVPLKDVRVPLKEICTPIAKKCNPPPKITNAVIMAPFEKEYPSDTRLTYRCRDTYVLHGDATILCNNGMWERKSINCKAPTDAEDCITT